MTLPDGFRFMGHDWTIEDGETELPQRSRFGESLNYVQRVSIDTRTPLDRQQETLLHEITHVVSDELLADEHHISEFQIRVLSRGLFQILRDNPAVLSFIAAEVPDASQD